ncbi:hypothetical protein [Nocardioides limicola]|uniref:hypothetical protein n=1 Tax=Nocardioides limicola TaxID=2803368 RepID=UPI00193BD22C|nr:hypothetical protein [Nocardioides sp. DJM-14]
MQAEPRDLLMSARFETVDGPQMWVQLPMGQVHVAVGDPMEVVPPELTNEPGGSAADPGFMFVPLVVEWNLEGRPFIPSFGRQPSPEPVLSLSIGEEEYRLGRVSMLFTEGAEPAELRRGGYFLHVPKVEVEVSTLALLVEFDGVRQTAYPDGSRDAGEAGGLYGLPTYVEGQSCAEETWEIEGTLRGYEPRLDCLVKVLDYPYLAGHGWAHDLAADHSWVIVEASAHFSGVVTEAGQAAWEGCQPRPGRANVAVSLGGDEPMVELSSSTPTWGSSVSPRLLVAFLAPRGDDALLQIEGTFGCFVLTPDDLVDHVLKVSQEVRVSR